ncbi:cardiolipin synthase [Maritalea mediterranea]|uniref:Cardiolipin synthase n=1 Tax=Maritalea mediterranea TaxID=2909667 RepID=A0ABS9EAT3_9HYPH|nr:cardiolipin synthase [Maritalea mediterranea]MCF4098865.1 cardiolipin synthase [Maritalea mediterranea]
MDLLSSISLATSFYLAIVIGVTLRILARKHISSAARLAWFTVVVTLPAFGIVLYTLLGEVHISRKLRAKKARLLRQMKKLEFDRLEGEPDPYRKVPQRYHAIFQYAQTINRFPLSNGNRAELLYDAEDTRKRIIADIDQAKDHVHLLYYIWLNDHTGTDIAHAVIRAAQRGVACRVMADAIGSRVLLKSDLWVEMQRAGVQTETAMPFESMIATHLLNRFDLRNHRKITVIDGKIAYCGSQNCADPEFRPKAKYAPWIDIMARLEGPVVNQTQLLFASDWMSRREESTLKDFPLNARPLKNGFVAQVNGNGPTERRGAAAHLFATLIASADQEINITTPYFVPDIIVLNALCAAAIRGVKINLIVPRINDSWVVAAASKSFYSEILAAGVRVHEYVGGLLHVKCLTIDGQITMIGSSNLDLRSFDLNYENNTIIYDKKFTQQVNDRQDQYLKSAIEVQLQEVRQWRLPTRIWHNVIGTLGPVL